MVLVVHFNFELYQIDVKTAFFNGNINKTMYMVQQKNFILGDPKNMMCKIKNFFLGSNKYLDNNISNFIK